MENCAWMKKLPDDLTLDKIVLPGTHNSSARYTALPLITRCQSLDIRGQLCAGVRFLDIRLEMTGDTLKTVHSVVDCRKKPFGARLYVDEVFSDCADFLRHNPSETVLMLIAKDSGREQPEQIFNLFYDKFILPHRDIWFCENRFPTLGECRGKLVLVRRAAVETGGRYTDKNSGLNVTAWQDMGNRREDTAKVMEIGSVEGDGTVASIVAQDRYMHSPENKWKKVLCPQLSDAPYGDGMLRIHFASTAGGKLMPCFNAKKVNRYLASYPFKKRVDYGWIILDFASEKLCRRIYELNFS